MTNDQRMTKTPSTNRRQQHRFAALQRLRQPFLDPSCSNFGEFGFPINNHITHFGFRAERSKFPA